MVIEAVRQGDAGRLRELVERDRALAGARDGAGVSALMLSLYQSRPDLAEILLAAEPELDVFEAASLGQAERLAALLERDPGQARAWSADGFTALHFAAFFARPEAADLLLGRGADPNALARNHMQVRPLHSAVVPCDRRVVELLLDAGADVNARQHGGWTALHAAAQHGDAGIAARLIERGADARAANDDGKTALGLARERGHAAVAALLEQAEQRPGDGG